jgi:hypothetical protein
LTAAAELFVPIENAFSALAFADAPIAALATPVALDPEPNASAMSLVAAVFVPIATESLPFAYAVEPIAVANSPVASEARPIAIATFADALLSVPMVIVSVFDETAPEPIETEFDPEAVPPPPEKFASAIMEPLAMTLQHNNPITAYLAAFMREEPLLFSELLDTLFANSDTTT